MATALFQKIASKYPYLKDKLKHAGIPYKPDEFVKRTFLSSFYATTGIVIFVLLILLKFSVLRGFLLIFPPIIFLLLFFYLIKIPDAKLSKIDKDISKEVVFAGRYLIIEIESGVPLYNAMINVSKNYKIIGKYFSEITNKVDLGTSMEDALNEAVEFIPSQSFRRILWQIINSLRTGSDIAKSLSSVIQQIAKEQAIEVSEYGRKLNPMAMFYMIIAVILPSLGITMLIILSSFIEFELSLTILIVIAFLLAFVQFMFLSIIKFTRPAIDF